MQWWRSLPWLQERGPSVFVIGSHVLQSEEIVIKVRRKLRPGRRDVVVEPRHFWPKARRRSQSRRVRNRRGRTPRPRGRRWRRTSGSGGRGTPGIRSSLRRPPANRRSPAIAVPGLDESDLAEDVVDGIWRPFSLVVIFVLSLLVVILGTFVIVDQVNVPVIVG